MKHLFIFQYCYLFSVLGFFPPTTTTALQVVHIPTPEKLEMCALEDGPQKRDGPGFFSYGILTFIGITLALFIITVIYKGRFSSVSNTINVLLVSLFINI